MAVATAWSVHQTPPSSPLRFSCFDFERKESNLSIASSILQRPSSRNGRNFNLCCRCSGSSSSLDWDWNRWSRHFSEIDQSESFSSVLKFQLEEAIENEDFLEASRLKTAIGEATSKDIVAEVMSQLKDAINEERYHDASRICYLTGSGLVGWWAGWSKDSDDPFGRIVRITPALGRFLARSYSPRQLINASVGTPLFEIFVVKNADQTYKMQAVLLQPQRGSSTPASSPPSKPVVSKSTSNSQNSSNEDIPKDKAGVIDNNDESNKTSKETTDDSNEEGLTSVINFLKERIPGLKVKVMNINVPDELKEDSTFLEQVIQEDEKTNTEESPEDEMGSNLEGIPREGLTVEEGKNMSVKLVIGGVLQNQEENPSKIYVRLPAEIENMERDSFIFNISGKNKDSDGEKRASKIKVAAIAAHAASELMPLDVAKAFWTVDKAPPKVSKDVREIVKLAISQAQRRSRLSPSTIFNRIVTDNDGLDPFDGLYCGAFGPYGSEVIQLRRKFGHWHGTEEVDKDSNVDFFEYVEAFKLTGDLNVPAGQVTFRAKVGKGHRFGNRGSYPEELGVITRYKGQGRIAEPGFQNPRWVDGELLLLNGKGMGHLRGAELGFLYIVPEQSFLVLFDRLKLPD